MHYITHTLPVTLTTPVHVHLIQHCTDRQDYTHPLTIHEGLLVSLSVPLEERLWSLPCNRLDKSNLHAHMHAAQSCQHTNTNIYIHTYSPCCRGRQTCFKSALQNSSIILFQKSSESKHILVHIINVAFLGQYHTWHGSAWHMCSPH